MKVSFCGAARSVTGSRHLIKAGATQVLLDCGMYQGRRQDSDRFNRRLGFDATRVHAVLLSHAHIDHSGALPILAKEKFKGPVYMTDATADLTSIMLHDSARIQKSDTMYLNKKERRRGTRRLSPYYNVSDVRSIIQRFSPVRYGKTFRVSPRIKAEFLDAGHILGSSSIWLKHTHQSHSISVLFSGDVGRSNMPILKDPQPPPACDILILESTYGDRVHDEDFASMKRKAQELVTHAQKHKSKIIVPAFAIGRTQELVMYIKELVQSKEVDPIPIFIDSPLALKATDVFRQHPDCFDQETYHTFTSQTDPFGAHYIRYVSSVQESQALNGKQGPCIIISASGMCEGGRVLHHLKHALPDEKNIIALVGFQAEHTLGRKLIEEWDTVPILGRSIPCKAKIIRFNGLSAHADRNDLLTYVRNIDPLPEQTFVVHGEERQSYSLAAALRDEHPHMRVIVPELHSTHQF